LYLVRSLVEDDLQGKLELQNDVGAVVRLTFGLAEGLDSATS
jgi:two-component sensor histidine kinase